MMQESGLKQAWTHEKMQRWPVLMLSLSGQRVWHDVEAVFDDAQLSFWQVIAYLPVFKVFNPFGQIVRCGKI
jgi:hypothetical protein